MRLDLIIRTSKRKKDARSPQQQRDLAGAWAQAHGHEIVAVHDSGRDESGKTMDRASIRAARERIRAGATDGVLFALTDRLGRAPIEEAMTFVRELDRIGYLALADAGGEPVNLREPSAETNLVLQLQMARQQWLVTANRFKQSQRDAIAAGRFVGPTPFGYVRRSGRLYEHEARGPIVRRAFRLAAGPGLHAAVEYLREAAPGRRWDTDSVRRLLASRVYLGESRVEHVDEVLLNERAHDALTTPGDWHAAQSAPRVRRASGDYPLTHVATCAACGAGLIGALQSVHGKRYRRMRCSQVCTGGVGSISADGLEAFVREALREALAGVEFRLGYDGGDVDSAEAALELAESRLARYLEDLETRDEVGEVAWRAGRRAHSAAVTSAREALANVAAQSARSERLPAAAELDDPVKFGHALAVIGRLEVAGGRRPIVDRVVLDWIGVDDDLDDLDDGVGVLAA